MELDERIAQFRNMADADPENEMAHFSLGSTLLQAGRPAEAAAALRRCIDLNPYMSKAYQLVGQAHKEAGNREAAIEILSRGYPIAASRGDVLPREAIAALLTELGAPVPEVADAKPATNVPPGIFICQATSRPGNQLEKPPFKGALGQKIYESISAETWRTWIGQGTKIINELRLDLSREDHQRVYDQHMIEFLDLEQWAAKNL